MFLPVANPPMTGPAMAATNHQAADTAESKKCTDTQNGDVDVRKRRTMQQCGDNSAHHHNGNLLVVINELLFTGDDLGGKGQRQDGGHGGDGDCRDYREWEAR